MEDGSVEELGLQERAKGAPFYRFRKVIVFDDKVLDDFEI